jgi:NADH:ubiquinone oxidoreductase subunit E
LVTLCTIDPGEHGLFSQASHNSRISAIRPVPGDAAVLARITGLISDLRPDDVDLLKGLHRVQHEFGYVPREAIRLLAAQLETTPAIVFGTIDFYSELRLEPPADQVVEWCSGPACLLKGSLGIRRALEAELGCFMDQASADGKFELRLAQCDGTCQLAPQIRHGGRYIGPLTTSEAIRFARGLKGSAGPSVVPLPADEPGPQPEGFGDATEVGAPSPGGRDLPEGEEASVEPRPPLAPDVDPTREPGE